MYCFTIKIPTYTERILFKKKYILRFFLKFYDFLRPSYTQPILKENIFHQIIRCIVLVQEKLYEIL